MPLQLLFTMKMNNQQIIHTGVDMTITDWPIAIRATPSRLDKGFIAVPAADALLFPKTKCAIEVAFDEGHIFEQKSYIPKDESTKENRLFGISSWFERCQIRPGDIILIRRENDGPPRYRITTERFMKAKLEHTARLSLFTAESYETAVVALSSLARLTKLKPKDLAIAELKLMIRVDESTMRGLRDASRRPVRAPAAVAVRTLLACIYDGKCQICSLRLRSATDHHTLRCTT